MDLNKTVIELINKDMLSKIDSNKNDYKYKITLIIILCIIVLISIILNHHKVILESEHILCGTFICIFIWGLLFIIFESIKDKFNI